MPSKAEVTLPFPAMGIDRSQSFTDQGLMTTVDSQNVRPNAQGGYRARGGSRPGLGLALRTELGAPVRMLNQLSLYRPEMLGEYEPFNGTSLGYGDSSGNVTSGPEDVEPVMTHPVGVNGDPTRLEYLQFGSDQGNRVGLKCVTAGSAWSLAPPDAKQGTPATTGGLGYLELSMHIQPVSLEYTGRAQIYYDLASYMDDPTQTSRVAILEFDSALKRYTFYHERWSGGTLVFSDNSPSALDPSPNLSGVFTVRLDLATSQVRYYWREIEWDPSDGFVTSWKSQFGTSDPSILVTEYEHEYTRSSTEIKLETTQRRDALVAVANGNLWVETTTNNLTQVPSSLGLNPDLELQSTDREQLLYIADFGVSQSGSPSTASINPSNTLTDTAAQFQTNNVTTDNVLVIEGSNNYQQNERQQILMNPAAATGFWRITFEGETTVQLGALATDVDVKNAMEGLSNLSVGDINVKLHVAGQNYIIVFEGNRAGTNVEELVVVNEGLLDGSSNPVTVTVSTVHDGGGPEKIQGVYEITAVNSETELLFDPPIDLLDVDVSPIGVAYTVGNPPKIYDPSVGDLGEIRNHTAEEGKGVVPVGPRLVALYKDRIIYAASDSQPHVWWASRQGDPNDWDFTQEDSGAAVFSQGSSLAGRMGDPITAIIPHSDDCLVVGAYNNLHIVRGDPGYGGTMSLISDKIGIVGPHAWSKVPDGMVCFMSADGLYIISAGCHGAPVSLSRERLPDELTNLTDQREIVTLEYDTQNRGLHIMVTRRDSSTSSHWWYDWERKSFWRVKLKKDHEPHALHERTAWDNQQRVLLGGRDGRIRYFDRAFEYDDGDVDGNGDPKPLDAYLLYGPFQLQQEGYDEGVLTELKADMGEVSGRVQWDVFAGQTSEECWIKVLSDNSRESGYWSGANLSGQQYTSRPRVRGVSAIVRVKSGEIRRWFMERVTGVLRSAGRRRRR